MSSCAHQASQAEPNQSWSSSVGNTSLREKLDGANILFMTFDSCRLDTAARVSPPTLGSLSQLIPAETSGSFTYPAHMAFFAGFLPLQTNSDWLFLDEFKRVWRSGVARKSRAAITFEPPNVIEHYRKLNYHVAGWGGVQWFDSRNSGNQLPRLFPEFTYNGVPPGPWPVEVSTSELPLSYVDDIIGRMRKLGHDESGFFFINCSETHFPYWTPNQPPPTGAERRCLEFVRNAAQQKVTFPDAVPVSTGFLGALREMQMQALSWVDKQLRIVFDFAADLLNSTLVIACGDHGESFGENGRFGHGYPDPPVMRVPMWAGLIPGKKWA